MNDPSSYRGRRVVVLGLAKSGVSAATALHRLGADVVVNDRKPREQSPEAEQLEALGIPVICGHHPDDLIDEDTALLVKNPGIPYSAPPVVRAEAAGVEIVTEVELAYRLSRAPILGITGSNGKTTTTTWTGALLSAAGIRPLIAGNIGRPMIEAALEAEPDDWLVTELSSFQLKGTTDFRPAVAVVLNLAETHLDYHGTMDDYVASKAKLLVNQRPEDTAVLNWDDPRCRELAALTPARLLSFSLTEELAAGVFVRPPYPAQPAARPDTSRRVIVCRDAAGREDELLEVGELGVPGRHNAANALAAVAAAVAAGAAPARLAQPL
ncbi:UDP-N-acetylmuramoyl-L-alanine--D-glutamate ligase, partial [Paenibacillus sp. IB182496]